MSHPVRIIVIGGGPAGMTAAIAAARNGAHVVVLERMHRVGKKLLATGNGRCNLTNLAIDLANYHGASPSFADKALRQMDARGALAFFEDLGIAVRDDSSGRVFPACGQAAAILDVLRFEMEVLGVEVICDFKVQSVEKRDGRFVCRRADGATAEGGRIILAGGGKSAPNLGSDGSGFKIAQALGHRVAEPFPSLVQIRLDAPYLKSLKGLSVEGLAEARVNKKPIRSQRGELLFTEYGITGLPALYCSRVVSDPANRGKDVALHIDLFPERARQELAGELGRRFSRASGKPVDRSLIGLLHKRLIPVVLREAGLKDARTPCGAVSRKETQALAAFLKDWRIPCRGTESWMTSQVTAGGVDVSQVDGQTLESKIVPGLYFAGEILDIDGDCGGFNLQWAWSSGYAAGIHASRQP